MPRPKSGPKLVAALVMLALALAGASWIASNWRAMPWQPLSLSAPVGPFTRLQIKRAGADADGCRALLAQSGERLVTAPIVRGGPKCAFADGVRLLDDAGFAYQPATPVACRVALGLFLWERQTLQPVAQTLFGVPVVAVETLGSYNCRRIGGGATGSFSQHARANALDISAFRLADGTRISVLADWADSGPKGTFLRRVRNGACGSFATVLSPDFNAAHRDHFHVDQADRSGWSVCR